MTVSPRKSTNTPETPRRTPPEPHRKPQADLYTVLLAIALVAVLVGILFLYLEMDLYEFKFKGGPPVVNGRVRHQRDQESVRSGCVSDAASTSPTLSHSAFILSLSPDPSSLTPDPLRARMLHFQTS